MGLLFHRRRRSGSSGIRRANVNCPRCGSPDVEVVGGGLVDWGNSLVDDFVPGGTDDWVNDYRCLSCGFRWNDWD